MISVAEVEMAGQLVRGVYSKLTSIEGAAGAAHVVQGCRGG